MARERMTASEMVVLSKVTFLPESGEKKAVYSGFVSGISSTFVDSEGVVVEHGKCPVRFFGSDAEDLFSVCGIVAGHRLELDLVAGAQFYVYRLESGELAFLALSTDDVTSYFWRPAIVQRQE